MKTRAITIERVVTVTALAAVLLAGAPAWAVKIDLGAALAQPVLRSGATTVTYLKVGLTGFHMDSGERTPVNEFGATFTKFTIVCEKENSW